MDTTTVMVVVGLVILGLVAITGILSRFVATENERSRQYKLRMAEINGGSALPIFPEPKPVTEPAPPEKTLDA